MARYPKLALGGGRTGLALLAAAGVLVVGAVALSSQAKSSKCASGSCDCQNCPQNCPAGTCIPPCTVCNCVSCPSACPPGTCQCVNNTSCGPGMTCVNGVCTCTSCNCTNCPSQCGPSQCTCACDCNTCPQGCAPGYCCPPAATQNIALNPTSTFSLSTVTWQVQGFACNDNLSWIITPPLGSGGQSTGITKSDSTGSASGSFYTGFSGPGLYTFTISGQRGGSAQAGFVIII